MFVTKRNLAREIDYLERQLRDLNDKYWSISFAHNRLLDKLGLHEETVREHVVIREKGGPENGSGV